MTRPSINLVLWITLLFVRLCPAQPLEYGFLNIANMVPNHPPCEVRIDGKELLPGGLKAVHATGWFMVPQGTYRMTLSIEGFASAQGSITVLPRESTLCAIFLQQIGSATDRDGKPVPPKIRIKRLPSAKHASARELHVLSLCPADESFQMGGKTFALKPLESVDIPQWSGAPWIVMHQQKQIGQCLGAEEKGRYTLLLASDHQSTVAALMVRTDPQELPPWMKEGPP